MPREKRPKPESKRRAPKSEAEPTSSAPQSKRDLFPVVGIGASAGGLEPVKQILRALPADTGMAFVVVQHLAPRHASVMASILARETSMHVEQVTDRPAVQPNHVYVIPPDRTLILVGGVFRLLPRERDGAPH